MTEAIQTRAQLDRVADLLDRALRIADEIGDTYLGALISEVHDLATTRDEVRPSPAEAVGDRR